MLNKKRTRLDLRYNPGKKKSLLEILNCRDISSFSCNLDTERVAQVVPTLGAMLRLIRLLASASEVGRKLLIWNDNCLWEKFLPLLL